MLLQKVQHESDKPGSGSGLKLVFYVISLIIAFLAGQYHERSKHHEEVASAPETTMAAATPEETPVVAPTPTPVASQPVVAATTPSPRPTLISETPTPMPSSSTRIERATAVERTPAATQTTASAAVPIPSPAKQAGDVTITEPVEIPVKTDGKITGYINLQKGQVITPISVEKDAIKVKSGSGFVMVPVKSTDMAR